MLIVYDYRMRYVSVAVVTNYWHSRPKLETSDSGVPRYPKVSTLSEVCDFG